MHNSAVFFALGRLLQVMGIILLVPLGIAVSENRHLPIGRLLTEPVPGGFIAAIAAALVLGTLLVVLFRAGRELQGIREGFAIVTVGWCGLALISAIPLFCYFMAGQEFHWQAVVASFTDAYFEVMSGFTTTGATVFGDVEALPDSLLFLRALTHWLGGMGIITLALVIFPSMGVAAYQIFRGEVPGPSKDKLRPRLSQTVSILWGVYVLLTGAEIILLLVGGMSIFEAVCHAFATMATGGFSTENASLGAYGDFIQWVVILFMYLAGINFVLHFRALRGDVTPMLKNREFLFYTGIIVFTIILVTGLLYVSGPAPIDHAADHYRHSPMTETEFAAHYEQQTVPTRSLYDTFRVAAFQTVAIVTTTGFVTADFDLWPDFLRFLLVLLMFCGGCAGSTGGGMKMIRIMIVYKVAINCLRKLTQPKLVAPVKVGERVIDNDGIVGVVSFFILFVGLFVVVAALMTLFVDDLTTAVACSAATIGNIGPGLAGIGAVENYGWIPLPGKWLLILSMLLGRLEIFTVLIVLRPSVWRR
jgi:trk system potassium uptake protein TrkH